MKIWKVILATIVIFAAGAFSGGMLVKTLTPKPQSPIPPHLLQQRFQARLKKELSLSSDQTNRIDKIFADSAANMKILWDLLGPDFEAEKREVRAKIRSELTPQQRDKFEQLLKEPHRSEGQRRFREGTNQTNSANSTAK